MSGKYKIGDYEFNTYEEYLAAQEDAKKIDFITKELDITEPDVAVRLYTLIRNKEIVFRTKLGISFSWYVMDVLAQNSQKLLEEKREKEEQKQKGKKARRSGRDVYPRRGGLSGILWRDAVAGAFGEPGV